MGGLPHDYLLWGRGEMRTTVICLVAVALCLCSPAFAQNRTPAPFAELDKQVKTQEGGWAGSKQPLATLFNAERKRLGDEFEKELLKYIGIDVEKHYWVSLFLTVPDYLHGNKPLPKLALVIKDKALSLLSDKQDEDSLGSTVELSVTAAVLSETIGEHSLAAFYKERAERLLARNPDLRAWFPFMGDKERQLYNSIGPNTAPVVATPEADQAPNARVMGGILNGKAINKPVPVYPLEARNVQGEVRVKVVIDESGKVMWAQAVSGPEPLRAAAVAAARRTTFLPTTVQGKPEKVTGFLLYKFTH
ncbi:MAG: TonB family protein [Pyrinomonadaceae bacterium]